MIKTLILKAKGWARGRNGFFFPKQMDFYKDPKGNLNLSVSSKRFGKTEPICLTLSREDALGLAQGINSLYGAGKETRVVVVIEGGNVQEIMANRPGVHVVKVDYDSEGADRDEVKRVLQYGDNNKKTYELAFVRHWGEATPDPKDTKRFFRNAV
jgi:hypothetical protein